MIRNTGSHPFNSEASLPRLQQVGWITPPSLHVVRNHGAVPRLRWSEHQLKITGVPKPVNLSMDEIPGLQGIFNSTFVIFLLPILGGVRQATFFRKQLLFGNATIAWPSIGKGF